MSKEPIPLILYWIRQVPNSTSKQNTDSTPGLSGISSSILSLEARPGDPVMTSQMQYDAIPEMPSSITRTSDST